MRTKLPFTKGTATATSCVAEEFTRSGKASHAMVHSSNLIRAGVVEDARAAARGLLGRYGSLNAAEVDTAVLIIRAELQSGLGDSSSGRPGGGGGGVVGGVCGR